MIIRSPMSEPAGLLPDHRRIHNAPRDLLLISWDSYKIMYPTLDDDEVEWTLDTRIVLSSADLGRRRRGGT
jgi:hypothetical protein